MRFDIHLGTNQWLSGPLKRLNKAVRENIFSQAYEWNGMESNGIESNKNIIYYSQII